MKTSEIEFDVCTICGKKYHFTGTEVWRTADATEVSVPLSTIVVIPVETESGEIEICEFCYRDGVVANKVSLELLFEIHLECGLEFANLRRYKEALQALKEARERGNNAQLAFAFGCTYAKMGMIDLAEASYRETIQLDPKAWWALSNLKLLGLKRDLT